MGAHRMGEETVERLLAGPAACAEDAPEALVRLLAALRAAPHPHELNGEAVALRAFRVAQGDVVRVVAASRPDRRFVTGLVSAKMALAALLLAATGGVAAAATAGTLPGPLGGGERTGGPGSGQVSPPVAGPDGSPTRPAGPGSAPSPTSAATGTPGGRSALIGLCTAYRAQPDERRQRALATPAFADLVTAAGGREEVAGYCDRLLDGRDKTSGPDDNHSAPGGKSTGPGGNLGGDVAGRPGKQPGELRRATRGRP